MLDSLKEVDPSIGKFVVTQVDGLLGLTENSTIYEYHFCTEDDLSLFSQESSVLTYLR